MKNNNRKQSLTFLTILSFFTVTASSAIAAIEPSLKREVAALTTEQQSETPAAEKTPKLDPSDNDETWEKVELEQELQNILGNDSQTEILIASRRSV